MIHKTQEPQKWGLLIGINKYQHMKRLKGCGNDVELISKILQENFNFRAEQIVTLKDREATRQAILEAMDALVEGVGSNDIVVIHYSGHGSQMTDREGDEKDGLDETIVPYDSGRKPHPNRDITDDEIYLRLLRLSKKTPNTTLIFDCCHSGTISRDSFGTNERWVEPDLRPIEELPPSPIAEDLGMRDCGQSGWFPLNQSYVLIAACRDEEKAYEYFTDSDQLAHGVLTYYLGQELSQAESGNTYRDIFEQVSRQVTGALRSQHPQLEGARDRLLFGVKDIKPMSFIPILKCQKNKVILGGGAAHGLTVGSHWSIYPSGTKQVRKESPKLGLVEITAVQAVTSEAKIIEAANSDEITTGNRAVEEVHSYGQMSLKIEIKVPTSNQELLHEIVELIGTSPLLKQVQTREEADARLYLIGVRTEVSENTPVPQLGILAEPTWSVVGKDGQILIPPQSANRANAAQLVRDNLERIVRYRQMLSLRNPNRENLLKDRVEFIVKRQSLDDSWVVAEPDSSSGEIIFKAGERIAVEIVNHHDAPVYIGILDFGLTGKVSLLHPIEGSNEQLMPGQRIEIGVRQGDEIELQIPDDFPFTPTLSKGTPIGEKETFKLLVANQETDFSLRVQEGFEKRNQPNNPLRELIDIAWLGDHGRDAVRVRNRQRPEEEWIALERSFFLKMSLN